MYLELPVIETGVTDADGDGLANTSDAFPLVSIEGYTDTDGDGRPDDCNSACVNAGMTADTDDDNDGVLDTQDAYPLVSLGDLLDTDGDGFPNDCDPTCQTVGMIADSDDDGDALLDGDDNCPLISNADQADADGDGVGDICDGEDNDTDGDGVLNEGDNCRLIANADQRDLDGDDIGDLCDDDDDGDSCPDKQDAFPNDPQRCEAGNQKAIVVAGGGPYAGNYLWPATEAMAEFERTFGEDEEAAALKIQQRARGMRDRCVGVCGCVWACVAVNDSVRG